MRLLLTGAKGQLGHSLTQYTPAGWETLFADKVMLDITRESDIERIVCNFKPTIIINAAAYTLVDNAENEKEKAYSVNVNGARLMARAAKLCGASFFHMSTDYVFDGQSFLPYKETDECCPINVYGDSKRKGEIAVLEENGDAIVLRTSWVYSEYGQNFLKTISNLIDQEKEIKVVADQIGCPTYANDIAKVLYQLSYIKNLPGGIYHYSGDTSLSWYDFSKMIASAMNKRDAIIQKVSSNEFQSVAKRPQFSVMDCTKILNLGIQLSNLEKGVQLAIHNLELVER
ncbi:dTDP-4-dehydrorhamnose reductase [Franconibacter helveticus 513]|uniref:dTDP-4-dehydrorhamnose reductase n=1 Tax=Franconibacter helveticus TaxID=357240 RepID=UPI0004634425|nr:dTDP-4-dehydrorhamnose reductase [Franconibacter helveticus]